MRSPTLLSIVLIIILVSCSNREKETRPADENIVAQIGTSLLTKQMINQLMIVGLTEKDSLDLVERIIQKWAISELLYQSASWDNRVQEEIEKKVENYRRELIIFETEKRIINEEFSSSNAEELLKQVFPTNKKPEESEFATGVIVIMSKGSRLVNQVRSFYRLKKDTDLDGLSKLTESQNIEAHLFVEAPLSLEEIQTLLPKEIVFDEKFIKKKKIGEYTVSNQAVFINITQYYPKGTYNAKTDGNKSLSSIKKPTYNKKVLRSAQSGFLENYKFNLYEQALKENRLIIHRQQ